MERCLRLAAQAEGRTAPNPVVGAVVVDRQGKVVGEGHHERAGLAHAEVVALDLSGEAARDATLYVNLEPCCHFGKTPPCVARVIASGVTRVVAGMVDPNPEVAGNGIKALKGAGIEVEVGVCEKEARWLNRGFIKHASTGLPWLCLKLATTLDAKIADRKGQSRWISGPEARQHVHQLRNRFDCVLIGGATALRDNPELNVRGIENARDPLRAVVDPDLSVSADARICRRDSGSSTVLFCSPDALKRRGKSFPDHVRLVKIERDPATVGYLDLHGVMRWLAQEGNLTVLCEGGGRLAAGLIAAQLVDEVHWMVSPMILADMDAVPAIPSFGRVLLADAIKLHNVRITPLGADVLICGTMAALPN